MAREYVTAGWGLLVCPGLLTLDARHGQHSDRWPPCRRGQPCRLPHQHEAELIDPEGHSSAIFGWIPGCRPPEPEEWPKCGLCGADLVHADLDHPLDEKHLRPLPRPKPHIG